MLAVDDFISETASLAQFVHRNLLLDVYLLAAVLQIPERLLAILGLAAPRTGRGVHPFQLATQDVSHLVGLRVIVRDALVALGKVVLVVALVDVDGSVVELHYGVAYPVEKVPVVGYHKESAA